MGDELQIIVAANNIPANVMPHVVLELSEQDRLIPEATDMTADQGSDEEETAEE